MTSVDHNELSKHLEHEAFYSHILQLNIGGTIENVVLKDLQRHPAKPVVLHVDFQRISEDKRIRMLIPLHFINEDKCPGLKKGGTITRSVTEVEIECLPKNLPEYITVDVGHLDMGHSIHVDELILPPEVSLTHALDFKAPVASVHGTRGAGTETEAAAAPVTETAKAEAKPTAQPAAKAGSAKAAPSKTGTSKSKSEK